MASAQNIIVIVGGGVVQEVTFPSLDSPAVEVRDYDLQGCDPDGERLSIDKYGEPYFGYVWEPTPDAACSAAADLPLSKWRIQRPAPPRRCCGRARTEL